MEVIEPTNPNNDYSIKKEAHFSKILTSKEVIITLVFCIIMMVIATLVISDYNKDNSKIDNEQDGYYNIATPDGTFPGDTFINSISDTIKERSLPTIQEQPEIIYHTPGPWARIDKYLRKPIHRACWRMSDLEFKLCGNGGECISISESEREDEYKIFLDYLDINFPETKEQIEYLLIKTAHIQQVLLYDLACMVYAYTADEKMKEYPTFENYLSKFEHDHFLRPTP